MKCKAIKISIFILLTLFKFSFAKDYDNFYYWDFFGLQGNPMTNHLNFNLKELKSAQSNLVKKYSPDVATNFIQYDLYTKYRQLIAEPFEILSGYFEPVAKVSNPGPAPFSEEERHEELRQINQKMNKIAQRLGENSDQYKNIKQFYQKKVKELDEDIKNKLDPWQKKYDAYQKYKTWRENKNKVFNPLPLKNVAFQIIFDFYLFIIHQINQGTLDPRKILNFYNQIPDTNTKTKHFANIVWNLILIALKKPLQNKVLLKISEEKDKLNRLTISTINEKTIKDTIIDVFWYSYLSKDIRNTIVGILTKLAEAYKNKNNTETAITTLEETNNIIDTEWGTVFPIDNEYKDKIKSLFTEIRTSKIEKTIVSIVDNLLTSTQFQGDPTTFNLRFTEAIKNLKPFIPTSAPNILDIYLKWTNKQYNDSMKAYVLYLGLLDAGAFEADAKAQDLALPTTFDDKKNQLQQAYNAIPEQNKQNAKASLATRNIRDTGELEKANTLISDAETKGAEEAVKDYLQAINILRPFTPQTSAKIINIYIFIIEKYKNANDLDNAKKFVMITQDQVKNLELITDPTKYPIFLAAQEDLNNKAQEVDVAPMLTLQQPTPAPSKDLGQLNQLLIDLKNQLEKLEAYL